MGGGGGGEEKIVIQLRFRISLNRIRSQAKRLSYNMSLCAEDLSPKQRAGPDREREREILGRVYSVHRTRRDDNIFRWHQPCNNQTAL